MKGSGSKRLPTTGHYDGQHRTWACDNDVTAIVIYSPKCKNVQPHTMWSKSYDPEEAKSKFMKHKWILQLQHDTAERGRNVLPTAEHDTAGKATIGWDQVF